MSRPGRARLSTGHVRTVRDDASNKLGISAEAIVLDPVQDGLPIRILRVTLKVAAAAFVICAALSYESGSWRPVGLLAFVWASVVALAWIFATSPATKEQG